MNLLQVLPMKLHGTTTVILGQMVGVMMQMKGLNFAKEQLNLLLRKNTWFVNSQLFYIVLVLKNRGQIGMVVLIFVVFCG